MRLHCNAVVVTCIDYRFQQSFDRWLHTTLSHGNYDRVSIAGGVKNWETVFAQIELAKRLHSVNTVILVNHEDCGAYGAEGTPERHTVDLHQARDEVRRAFPDVEVRLYFARLDGAIERVD